MNDYLLQCAVERVMNAKTEADDDADRIAFAKEHDSEFRDWQWAREAARIERHAMEAMEP